MGQPCCKLLFSALLFYSGAIRSHLAAKLDILSHSIPTSFCQVSVSQWTLVACPCDVGVTPATSSQSLPTAAGCQKLSATKGAEQMQPLNSCVRACFPYIYNLMVDIV